jgi:REP-associated tyrosine transposase
LSPAEAGGNPSDEVRTGAAAANHRRHILDGGSYFFTANPAGRGLGLLTEHIGRLRAAFRQVRARRPFVIEAAVILPDRLHTISTLPQKDANFALRWRLIKGLSRAVSPAASGSPPARRQGRARHLAAAVLGA